MKKRKKRKKRQTNYLIGLAGSLLLLTVLLVVYQSGFLSGNGSRPGGQSQAEEAGTVKKAGLGEEPGADGEEGTGSGTGIVGLWYNKVAYRLARCLQWGIPVRYTDYAIGCQSF